MIDKKDTEILERRIADLENTLRELRQGMDGMEFAQIAITKRGDPVYVRTGRFSPAMGIQVGEYQELVDEAGIGGGTDLSDGDATNVHLVWDNTEEEWVKGVIVPDGDATNDHLLWSSGEWTAKPSVEKIIAGTNVTISPVGGQGEVTVNSALPTYGIITEPAYVLGKTSGGAIGWVATKTFECEP